MNKNLEEFLCIIKENLLNLLNIDTITQDIYYNPNIDRFVDFKKYRNTIIKKEILERNYFF